MRLRISIPSFKQIHVDLSPNKKVRDLRKLVCAKFDIEPELTKLLIAGRQLPETMQVSKLRTSTEPVIVDYLWARHLIAWGSDGQSRIRNSTVLIAGAGAIGNEVAKNLAMLGVGKLLIVDRDNVEMSNVSRMIFFEPTDLGMNKAEVLARNVHKKYPFVETLAFRGDLESLPLKFYLDSHVVVCGLDNVVSRIFLTQISRKYSTPMVDGGITGLNARVHVYIPPEDPCPICMFPPNQYSHIVGLRNPCDAPLEQEAVPSFATSISLVSSIVAQETAKLILGLEAFHEDHKWPVSSGSPLRSVLFIDLKNNRFTPMDLKRGEKCFVCGKDGTTRESVPRHDIPLAKIHALRKTPERAIREILNTEKLVRIFTETIKGEAEFGSPPKTAKTLVQGDYLKVILEGKNGELRESILRLI
jgi:molybdopterin/thiamine biosynthesis adenylyltransferase